MINGTQNEPRVKAYENLAISLTLENQENFWQTRLLWLACVQPPWPIRIAITSDVTTFML